MCVCVCVRARACVRACVRACACMCVCMVRVYTQMKRCGGRGPKYPFPRREHLDQDLLRLGVLLLVHDRRGDTRCHVQRFWMLLAEEQRRRRKEPAEHLLRLRMLPLLREDLGELACGHPRLGMFLPQASAQGSPRCQQKQQDQPASSTSHTQSPQYRTQLTGPRRRCRAASAARSVSSASATSPLSAAPAARTHVDMSTSA